MGDLFHPRVPFDFIDRVFDVMEMASHHTFIVLTKRAERMREYRMSMHKVWRPISASSHSARYGNTPRRSFPHIHLGVSVEDQKTADERIRLLLDTPAAVRIVSAEPLLGPVRILPYLHGIHHVIAGGESGPHARPSHPEWFYSLRDQCTTAQVAFNFKQWGEWTSGENVGRTRGVVKTASLFNRDEWFYGEENLARCDGHIDDEPDLYRVGKRAAGRMLDGVVHDEYPEARP